MRLEVHRFDAARLDDFFRLQSTADDAGWCSCVAWWVPSWQGWGDRNADQNRSLRLELCAQGQYDGYLLYVEGVPAGWCQVGPRDRLEKLVRQLSLDADPEVWAITCFQIAPAFRRQGLATYLLQEVLRDLADRGVRRVEAFPKRTTAEEPGELWNGPEAMYRAAGFTLLRDHPQRPVLSR